MGDQEILDDIENRFKYHRPMGDQTLRYEQIRDMGKQWAIALVRMCPDCRERQFAVESIEQAVMWANAAIARRESSKPDPDEVVL